MNHPPPSFDDALVDVRNVDAGSSTLVVCEHASPHIPAELKDLGLAASELRSHVVWDPGAMALATKIADELDATLIASRISRLVYDCNRPPDANDAIPSKSEVIQVPGNAGLSSADRARRVSKYYLPFKSAVEDALASKHDPVLVTVHSFTPVYHGRPREVEVGVLHDKDARLADALLSDLSGLASVIVRRNEPYGPQDGVTHTLKEHALPGGHLNVMLEVRSDLIANNETQTHMAGLMANWLGRALTALKAAPCKL